MNPPDFSNFPPLVSYGENESEKDQKVTRFRYRDIPLSADDEAFRQGFEESARRAIHSYHEAVEAAITQRIERRLGRMPTAVEIRESGTCEIAKDGTRTFLWQGTPLLVVPPINSVKSPN
jgi:hypothetical protein